MRLAVLVPLRIRSSTSSFPKLPQSADLVPRHISFTDPSINGIPLDAKISCNIFYGEPSIFLYLPPFTPGTIGYLSMPVCALHAGRAFAMGSWLGLP